MQPRLYALSSEHVLQLQMIVERCYERGDIHTLGYAHQFKSSQEIRQLEIHLSHIVIRDEPEVMLMVIIGQIRNINQNDIVRNFHSLDRV